MIPDPLEIAPIRAAYRAGSLTPVQLVTALLARIAAYPDKAVFISRPKNDAVIAQAEALSLADIDKLPLFGIPFVVKDNIDVAGMPTTAACPAFAFTPGADAIVVARLRAAGAIVLGKANLDQFATGLNGTRSPHGAPRSVFAPDYISGGSSSGSAVSVGAGLAVFSLGTDTAGSGRVPASINNIIGLKPGIGRIPTTGVLPACQSLDCVSIFANCAADALAVLRVAEGFDAADAYSRPVRDVSLPAKPRAGILRSQEREFYGNEEAAALYEAALAQAAVLGWELVEIDYAPFREIAAMLYGSAFAAERVTAIKPFFESRPDDIEPAVRSILEVGAKYSAADLFADMHRLAALKILAGAEMAKVDILLLPTAPTSFTVAEMLADPLGANAKLGLYTNFVNFMDQAAIALPAGFGASGLPAGITLIGPAFADAALAALADALHHALGAGAGRSKTLPQTRLGPPTPETTIVVAGAHLSGMVLNHELLNLGAKLVAAASTAPDYKLFALATTPPKPGLAQTPGFAGAGIAVEIWSLTAQNFGKFVAALPAPMGIGKVTLADGSTHPGFLCEAYALEGAQDITAYGGWRAYRAAMTAK
jgi:allophanate hydrolase